MSEDNQNKPSTEELIQQIRNKVLGPLTDDQIAKIPDYVAKYVDYTKYQGETDKAKAEAAIQDLYRSNGVDSVKVIWADSPRVGMEIAANLYHGRGGLEKTDIAAMSDHVESLQNDKIWVAIYEFMKDHLGIPTEPNMEILKRVTEHCGMFWSFEDTVVMCVRPLKVMFDSDLKLHNEDGPAIVYPDGNVIFALKGEMYQTLTDYMLARSALATKQSSNGSAPTGTES